MLRSLVGNKASPLERGRSEFVNGNANGARNPAGGFISISTHASEERERDVLRISARVRNGKQPEKIAICHVAAVVVSGPAATVYLLSKWPIMHI